MTDTAADDGGAISAPEDLKAAPEGYEQNMWHGIIGLVMLPIALVGCVLNGIDTNFCMANSADMLISMTGGCGAYAVPTGGACGETNMAAMNA